MRFWLATPGSSGTESRRVLRTEDGSVTETAIVVPAAMFVVLLSVQLVLWAHAQHIVQASAAVGVQAASEVGASTSWGDAQARQLLARIGRHVVVNPSVQVDDAPGGTIKVHVDGTVESILPWVRLKVSADRVGTRQEFRQSG